MSELIDETKKPTESDESKAEVSATVPPVPAAPVDASKATVPAPPVYVYVAPGPMPALPKLFVTKQALHDMTTEVLAHPNIETAWGLYGFRFQKAVYVVGVLRPVVGEVVRGYANATAGGEEMANAMRWLHANERLINKHVNKDKPAMGKFGFLYKGHSHHTLGIEEYSGTDHDSIFQAVKNDGMEVAVGPLALIRKHGVSYGKSGWGMNERLTCSRNSEVAFSFYIMTREMVDAGYREGAKIQATLVDSVHTLLVPPMGWEFSRDDDFKEQLRHLRSFGFSVKVNHLDANGKPPLEIQFVIDHESFMQTLIIVTDWNYPEVPPRIQLLPKSGSGMTMAEANRISAKRWWSKGDDFIDIVGRMLKEGGLK